MKAKDAVRRDEAAEDAVTVLPFGREAIQAFARNRAAVLGGAIVALILLVAVLAPFLVPHNPYLVDLDKQFLNPSADYLIGTDMFGRDVFARILYGSRISLLVGIVPTLISMAIGIVVGIVSGYYGGKVDFALMMVADMVLAFPSLLLAMVVMYTLGATLLNIFIALSLVGWAGTARVVRSQTL